MFDEGNPAPARGPGRGQSRNGNGGGGGRRGPGGPGGRGDRGGERGGDRNEPDHDGRGVPLSELDPALTEVSRKLIGCAIEVHKALGPGYEKPVYQRALEMELGAAGVAFKSNHAFTVEYRGERVGERSADLVVAERFVVEVVASRGEVSAAERTGVRALLRAADMELGLIINFAERRLKDGLVRVLNPEKLRPAQEAAESGAAAAPPEGEAAA